MPYSAVLPVVLILLTLLSALGGALLTSVTLDVSVGDAYGREIQVRALADGGLEQAREQLRMVTAPAPSITMPLATGVNYSVFLESAMNNVFVLRSTAQIGKSRHTVRAVVIRAGFPMLPAGLNMAGDAGLDPRLTTQAGIVRLVDEVSRNATDRYTGATMLNNVGGGNDYRVTVVDGDCDFGPGTGYGILLVRGVLNLRGDLMWNGLVLIVGEGKLQADPGARGRIVGGVFLARTLDNNPAVASFDPANIVFVLDHSETDPSLYKFPFKTVSALEF